MLLRQSLRRSLTCYRINANGRQFHNRVKEIAYFKPLLQNEPTVTVLTGPPSSGKSALLRHFIELEDDSINALVLNLRAGDYNTPQRLYYTLKDRFQTFLERAKRVVNSGGIQTIKIGPAEISTTSAPEGYGGQCLIEPMLRRVADQLPAYSVWKGLNGPKPVLIIDEANLLAGFGDTRDGAIILKSVLSWLVLCSKELRKFHVILATSEGFFEDWISKKIPGHYYVISIGDMSEKDARAYFDQLIDNRPAFVGVRMYWKDIYRAVGGRIPHISKLMEAIHLALAQGEQTVDVSRLVLRVFGDRYGFFERIITNPPTNCKSHSILKVMEALVSAGPFGFLRPKELLSICGTSETVHELIKHNMLYSRILSNVAQDDLDSRVQSYNGTIYTAASIADLHVMRDLLENDYKQELTG